MVIRFLFEGTSKSNPPSTLLSPQSIAKMREPMLWLLVLYAMQMTTRLKFFLDMEIEIEDSIQLIKAADSKVESNKSKKWKERKKDGKRGWGHSILSWKDLVSWFPLVFCSPQCYLCGKWNKSQL